MCAKRGVPAREVLDRDTAVLRVHDDDRGTCTEVRPERLCDPKAEILLEHEAMGEDVHEPGEPRKPGHARSRLEGEVHPPAGRQ